MKAVYDASAFNVSESNSRHAAGSADGMLHAPAALPPQAASSTILELEEIKVTPVIDDARKEPFYKIHKSKCNSWMCPECRLKKGLTLKKALLKKSVLFKEPRLYTITVNRNWFKNPADAYKYVMEKKFIARLLTKELKIKQWIWVLEAQENQGDGWPHWHILIDVAVLSGKWYNKNTKEAQEDRPDNSRGWIYVPHFLDLNKVHRLLHKWKIGGCYLSVKKESFKCPEHALNYIVKYLIKTPKRFFPEWMLKYKGLRFYSPSYALGSLSTEPKKNVEKEEENPEEEPQKEHEPRMPIDRISECGLKYFFSYYDSEEDKHIFTKPAWGLPESIQKTPGSVKSKDLSFETMKEYDIWGFEKMDDVINFEELWETPQLIKHLQELVDDIRTDYLSRWAESANDPG